MASVIALLFAVVAAAAAQVISPYGRAAIDPRIIHGGVAPIAARAGLREDLAFDAHPQYSFSYNVNEPLTGDAKTQTESRDGDVVQGSYSLVEPDGSVRTVDYTADDVSGFNAVVRKDGGVAPALGPAAIAAPIAPIAARGLVHPLARTSLGLGGIAHPLARSSLGLGGIAHPLARSSLGLAGIANPLALGGAYGSPYGLGGAYASPYAVGGHYASPYSPYAL